MSKQLPKKAGRLTHGLYVRDVTLPWEDRNQFAGLHNELKKEFFPSGVSEEECVLDLALLHWHKRNLWRLRTATVLRHPLTEDIVATGKKSWVGIRNGLREQARDERSQMQTIEATAATGLSQMTREVLKFAKNPDAEGAEKLGPTLNLGVELFRKTVMPVLEEMRQLPNAEEAFDNNYSPETLEKIVRLETAVDARINKVTARLVALKEFKRTPAGNASTQLT